MGGRKRNRLGEFFWSRTCRLLLQPSPLPRYCSAMHLRMPSIAHGVQSFLWALLFFVVMYFGMVALDIRKGTALLVSLVSRF